MNQGKLITMAKVTLLSFNPACGYYYKCVCVWPRTLHIVCQYFVSPWTTSFPMPVKLFSKNLLFFSWPLDILNSGYISLGFFFMRNLIWPISFWPYHTLTYLLLHMFSFLLCLWKKSYFLLCVAYYFRYGLNHTATYLFRGLIPFTHLYPNVAQNKSVSWSLTTSTWLFHWHIKKQCHNATLYSALIVVSIGVVIRNKGPSSTTLLGPQLHKMHM